MNIVTTEGIKLESIHFNTCQLTLKQYHQSQFIKCMGIPHLGSLIREWTGQKEVHQFH